MRKFWLIALILPMACTSSPQDTITLASNAMTCYQILKQATAADQGTLGNRVWNGVQVQLSQSQCQAVDKAAADLIASALNAKKAPVAGPVNVPATALAK